MHEHWSDYDEEDLRDALSEGREPQASITQVFVCPGHYVFEGSPAPGFLPPDREVEDLSFLAQAVLESVEGVSITKDSP